MINVSIKVNGEKRQVAPRAIPRENGMDGYLYRSRVRIGQKVYFAHIGLWEIWTKPKAAHGSRARRSGATALVQKMAQTLGISERTAWRRYSELGKNGDSSEPSTNP